MNRHSKHKAPGKPISPHQQLVEQLTAKQAILTSPYIDNKDLYDTRNLPEELLTAVHEAGLYDKLLTCDRCMVHLPDNVIQMLLHWIDRHGKAVSNIKYKFKPMTIKTKR